MAKILVQFNEATSKADSQANLDDRMISFFVDGTTEGFAYRQSNDTYMTFSSDEHIANASNDYAGSVGTGWGGTAVNVTGALDELRVAIPAVDISSVDDLDENRIIVSDGSKSIASSGMYVDSDMLSIDIFSKNRSESQMQKYSQSIATREYAYKLDKSSVYDGSLTVGDTVDPGSFGLGVESSNEFIFYSSYASGIYCYRLEADGTIISEDSKTATGDGARDSFYDGRYLCVAYGSGGVHTFSVDSDGDLTLVDSDDQGGDYIYIWGDGKFVYACAYENGIHTYRVGDDGTLEYLSTYDVATNRARAIHGDGKYLYVAYSLEGVKTFTVNSSGVLTLVDTDDQGDDCYHIHKTDDFLLVANYTGGILSYKVDSAGVLTFVDSDDQGGLARQLVYNGEYIYVANDTLGILTYTIDSDGTLNYITADDQGDSAKSVDCDERFVLLANDAGGLIVYTRDKAYDYNASTSTHTLTGAATIATVTFNAGTINAANLEANVAVKTDTINEKNAGNGVSIEDLNSNQIKTAKFDIGDWDMDTNATKNVTLTGVNGAKIMNISVAVRDDAGTSIYPLEYYDSSGGLVCGAWQWSSASPSIAYLERFAGCLFDGTDFNATSYNRGYLIVEYIV